MKGCDMLDESQLKSYRENGFLLVKGLLTKPEAATYRAESHALIERLGRTDADDPTWGVPGSWAASQ